MKTIIFILGFCFLASTFAQQRRSSESLEDCDCVKQTSEILRGTHSHSAEHLRCQAFCGTLRVTRALSSDGGVIQGKSFGRRRDDREGGGSGRGSGRGGRGRDDDDEGGRGSGRGGRGGNWGESSSGSSSSSSEESHERPSHGGRTRPPYGRRPYNRRPGYGYRPPSYNYGYAWYPQYPSYPTQNLDSANVNDVFSGQPVYGWENWLRSAWGTPQQYAMPNYGYAHGGY